MIPGIWRIEYARLLRTVSCSMGQRIVQWNWTVCYRIIRVSTNIELTLKVDILAREGAGLGTSEPGEPDCLFTNDTCHRQSKPVLSFNTFHFISTHPELPI